ncbi:Rieske 2Fe-2S domain-containing protein [Pseudonocardia sp. DSM 110487]|uniref:Rieske 2Fe-2S domain-containing protein n=1 Tax=Pseudonocardia sp. DSM 110487 TaxID=2865833 RepID=UPI001C694A7D|nr:Rieske 2Fe-2S domain-containing protein [Pseudonocardia sp. DSM 110487]QYN39271.1 Rieske 2Fe-2S domain-containing protein [Pseudonocardia sp. DSM 110487]
MLSAQDNEFLTRVGPGTPMGDLLRRYWTPALLVSEVPTPAGDPVRVRLLGEDLVAFRDAYGKVGLIQENCPHRGASLFYGRNELGPDGTCGLRCPYHGWQFGADGTCIDMPSEPPTSTFKERVRARSYPTHESGGIVWTYMGPAEAMTPFRDFGTESLEPDEVAATKLHTSCNWMQAMEGNMDTSHISWLHQWNGVDDIPDDGSDKPGYPTNAMSWTFWKHDRAPRLEIEDTWYGFKYVGIRTTPAGHTHVRMSAYCYPYHTVIASVPFSTQHGLFVPADDHNTYRYSFATRVNEGIEEVGGTNLFAVSPFEFGPAEVGRNGVIPRRYTLENDYGIDREDQRTTTYSGVREFISQDFMVTETMGPIYDRSQEHLGTSDKAIIRMRRLLIAAAKRLAEGVEPPAVAGDLDYRGIRSAEKILEDGEDWRLLGTDADPMVQRYDPGNTRLPAAGN